MIYEVLVFHNLAWLSKDALPLERLLQPNDPTVLVARLHLQADSDLSAAIDAARLLNKRDPDWTADPQTQRYWQIGNRSITYGDCFQVAGRFWTIAELGFECCDPPSITTRAEPGSLAALPDGAPSAAEAETRLHDEAIAATVIPDPDPWARDPWPTDVPF